MRSRKFSSPVVASLVALLAVFLFSSIQARAESPLLDPHKLPEVDDETAMLQADPGPADLRVVVAAPRAAITGRVSGVLLVARPGRTLNVVQGETVRFISGLREAVWYAGGGRIESILSVAEVDPAGGTTPIGRDGVARGGKAPKIARGIAAVNATFSAVGDVEIVAAVKVAANPVNGHATARARRVRYPVKVWAPGDLGSATGSVVDEANGTPLPGLRVLALDAATLQPVSAAITRLDGTYEILRLPPGDYLVGVRGGRGFEGEFFDDAPDPSTATTISVTAGAQVTGIDFVLSRISGF